MKTKIIMLTMLLTLGVLISFAGCGGNEEAGTSSASSAEAAVDATKYGYTGDDPIEATVYEYMATEIAGEYDKADASIPLVSIINVNDENKDDILVAGDFWVDNGNVEGDTLKLVSGGNHPGVIHMKKEGNKYVVTKMENVADGEGFYKSAQKLFGKNYERFAKINEDEDARSEQRTKNIKNYIKANGIKVTKYQETGWDPVDLTK